MSTSSWTPMIEPIHGPVPEGRPPWKDNAYLAFWDPGHNLFGSAHVSTSPNAEGRRARFSLSVDGRTAEVVEELEPGTFTSPSVSFEMGQPITVDSARLAGGIETNPLYGLCDYTTGSVLPELVPGERLQHFEHPVRVTGTLTLDGTSIEVDGHGFRDRTWGYRDESASWDEYIGIMIVATDFAISTIRLRGTDGDEETEGFLVPDSGANTAVTAVSVTRDGSSLLAGLELRLADGSEITVGEVRRRGGFWAPMGGIQKGPTLGEYDEFSDLTVVDGNGRAVPAFGMIAHAIRRKIY